VKRNRHHFTLVELGMAVGIVAALSTGYATAAFGQSSESAHPRPNSRSVITNAEIRKFGSNGSAHDLVHALRRSWLNLQHISLRETPTVTPQGKREALVTPASDATLLVYLDNVKIGDIAELRSLNLAGVLEVRYYNAGQAMRRWGSGHEHGAIEVITAANAGIPEPDFDST
jgi:hypothetical protein